MKAIFKLNLFQEKNKLHGRKSKKKNSNGKNPEKIFKRKKSRKKMQTEKKIHRFKNTLYIKNGAFPGAKLIYLKGKPK